MDPHPSVARARELLDVVGDDELRRMLEYWLSIHPGRCLPSRRDFDPADVPHLLGRMALTDVEYDPIRFRVRVMGTGLTAAFGRDLTGRYLHEAIPEFEASYTCAHRVEVAMTGLPGHCAEIPEVPFRIDFAASERLYLPFSSDGAGVDMLLTMTTFLADRATLSPFAGRSGPPPAVS
jgi:hypothetical protein